MASRGHPRFWTPPTSTSTTTVPRTTVTTVPLPYDPNETQVIHTEVEYQYAKLEEFEEKVKEDLTILDPRKCNILNIAFGQ